MRDSESTEVRRYKARYRFHTSRQLDATRPLLPGETIVVEGPIAFRATRWTLGRGLIRVTSGRVLILRHHVLSPDLITEIPRSAIARIEVVTVRLPSTAAGDTQDAIAIRVKGAKPGVADAREVFWATGRMVGPSVVEPTDTVEDFYEDWTPILFEALKAALDSGNAAS